MTESETSCPYSIQHMYKCIITNFGKVLLKGVAGLKNATPVFLPHHKLLKSSEKVQKESGAGEDNQEASDDGDNWLVTLDSKLMCENGQQKPMPGNC